MKIAIISDIHENTHNLVQAVRQIAEEQCDILFCLGDVGRSKLFQIIFSLEIPVYYTFGNNDGNVIKNTKLLQANQGVVRSNGFYQKVELEGRKFFLTHYDDLAKIVAKSGEFDACFGGHSHSAFEEYIGDTLCVNPGEIVGNKEESPCFYVYETITNTGKFHMVRDPLLSNTEVVKDFYKNMK